MKNVKISFLMLMDGSVSAEFNAVGKMSDRTLFFTDPEKNLYRFEISPGELLVLKRGPIHTSLPFRENTVTSGTMTAHHRTFDLTLQTTLLKIASESLDVTYDLLDGTTVISHHQLHVHWNLIT